VFKLVSRFRIARALGLLWQRRSLLPQDYLALTGRPLK